MYIRECVTTNKATKTKYVTHRIVEYYDISFELDEEQKKVVSISWNKLPSREKRVTLTGCYVMETSHRDLGAQEIWRLYTTLSKGKRSFP